MSINPTSLAGWGKRSLPGEAGPSSPSAPQPQGLCSAVSLQTAQQETEGHTQGPKPASSPLPSAWTSESPPQTESRAFSVPWAKSQVCPLFVPTTFMWEWVGGGVKRRWAPHDLIGRSLRWGSAEAQPALRLQHLAATPNPQPRSSSHVATRSRFPRQPASPLLPPPSGPCRPGRCPPPPPHPPAALTPSRPSPAPAPPGSPSSHCLPWVFLAVPSPGWPAAGPCSPRAPALPPGSPARGERGGGAPSSPVKAGSETGVGGGQVRAPSG